MARKELPWFKVTSDGVLDHPKFKKLTESDQLCWIKLLAIASEHNKNGELPEPWWIALRLGKQQPATCKMLARLIVAELVGAELNESGEFERLWMHDWSDWQGTKVGTRQSKSGHPSETKSAARANSTPQNPSVHAEEGSPSIRVEKIKRNNPSISPASSAKRRSGETVRPKPSMTAFHDAFWPLYPRKVGKHSAEKAWAALDPSTEEVAEITKALQAQIDEGMWQEPRFTPHPATWLNGRRWGDELPSRAPRYRPVEVAL